MPPSGDTIRSSNKAMRVLVFGASGATGRQLVGQALAEGHQVTAFVRNVSRLETRTGQLTVVVGDVAETTAVASAVEGQDGVLCALGAATPLRRDQTLVEGVRQLKTHTCVSRPLSCTEMLIPLGR